jgi:hypothetical protein
VFFGGAGFDGLAGRRGFGCGHSGVFNMVRGVVAKPR